MQISSLAQRGTKRRRRRRQGQRADYAPTNWYVALMRGQRETGGRRRARRSEQANGPKVNSPPATPSRRPPANEVVRPRGLPSQPAGSFAPSPGDTGRRPTYANGAPVPTGRPAELAAASALCSLRPPRGSPMRSARCGPRSTRRCSAIFRNFSAS